MSPLASEVRATIRLALPIIAVQLGMMAMGTVDVMMIGHYSGSALAAVGLGNVCIWALMVFGFGTLNALDPVVSQAIGAGDETSIRRGIQRGLILSILLAVPLSLLALGSDYVLLWLDQPQEVRPDALSYINWSIPGILPFFLFCAQRLSLQAFSKTTPLLWTILAANIFNAIANWVLIYGNWGFPELGVKGTAIASSIGRWVLAISLLYTSRKTIGPYLRPWDPASLRVAPLIRMLKIGLPLGGQYALEMGAFAFTLFLMGHINATAIGGHQVALNLASISFMVPVGISAAAAVRVGYGVGREDIEGTRRAGKVALVCGALVMSVFGAAFLLMPGPLVALYTDDVSIHGIAFVLVPIAGIFQVFDGIQVVAIGILRGLSDTRAPFVINLFGFWCVGIPFGYYLAFPRHMGPAGLWWGLVLGLAMVALLLFWRALTRLHKPTTRIMLD